MNYLSQSEYEVYGVEAKTPESWTAAASSLIDAHCRRPTLAVASYVERLRLRAGRNTVRLPAAGDIFPGDAVAVAVPSRGANFTAIVRDVQIALAASLGERERYRIQFANEAAAPLAFAFQPAHLREPLDLTATTATAGTEFIGDLPHAEITSITSTTVTIDAGAAPPAGGGIEVRRSDFGWGQENDRNLVGRFTTQVFTVTRLSRVADFALRQYDASSPPKYSRYSTALHVDYPL